MYSRSLSFLLCLHALPGFATGHLGREFCPLCHSGACPSLAVLNLLILRHTALDSLPTQVLILFLSLNMWFWPSHFIFLGIRLFICFVLFKKKKKKRWARGSKQSILTPTFPYYAGTSLGRGWGSYLKIKMPNLQDKDFVISLSYISFFT